MKIDIEQQDFGTLCICALRYCHGRRTYMPSLVQRIVGSHMDELSDKDIKVMYGDCRFMTLGDYGLDKGDWLKWEHRVRDELKRRGESNE